MPISRMPFSLDLRPIFVVVIVHFLKINTIFANVYAYAHRNTRILSKYYQK